MLLIPASVSMVHIAGSLVRALDANLQEKAAIFSDAHRLRLRVALHQGLCQRDATGWVGAPITIARRLITADALGLALMADRDARMALIVSDEIYQNVISHEYRLIDAASFAPITGDGDKAWLSIPRRAYPAGLDTTRGRQNTVTSPDRQETEKQDPEEPQAPRHQFGGIANYGPVTVEGDQVGRDKYEYGSKADKHQGRP
jgi:hypothetical protein